MRRSSAPVRRRNKGGAHVEFRKIVLWYELTTTDLDAAEAFYTAVVGWRAEPFENAAASPRYVVVNAGDRGVGGLTTLPDEAAKMGVPAAWMGYFPTKDING